eukprot:8777154-Pyramimonas_sp.AAC.1
MYYIPLWRVNEALKSLIEDDFVLSTLDCRYFSPHVISSPPRHPSTFILDRLGLSRSAIVKTANNWGENRILQWWSQEWLNKGLIAVSALTSSSPPPTVSAQPDPSVRSGLVGLSQ